jgi:hypothetical protein
VYLSKRRSSSWQRGGVSYAEIAADQGEDSDGPIPYFPICATDTVPFSSIPRKHEIMPRLRPSTPTTELNIEPRPEDGARDRSGTNRPTTLDSWRPKPTMPLSAREVDAVAKATAGKLAEFVGERGTTFGLVGPRESAEVSTSRSITCSTRDRARSDAARFAAEGQIHFNLDSTRRVLEGRAHFPVGVVSLGA